MKLTEISKYEKQAKLSGKGGPESELPYTAMLGRVNSFKFSMSYNDYAEYYYQSWLRVSGTAMPPSPGVKMYHLELDYDPVEQCVHYGIKHELQPKFKALLKWEYEHQPEQILHRSRPVTISCSPLRIAESKRRVDTVTTNMPTLKQHQMPDRIQTEILSILHDHLMAHLRYDRDWKNKYIAERWTSSTGEGLQWNRFIYLSDSQWQDILFQVRNIADAMTSSLAGWSQGTPFYTGIRARSPMIEKIPIPTEYYGTIDRSRIVMFHPAVSSWTLFMPDKKTFYADTLNEISSLLGVPEVHTPIVDGGEVYGMASDLINDGFLLRAFDGKAFEAQVGILMGHNWSQFFTNIGGLSVLPSGITLTSWLDTVCSMYLLSKLGLDYEEVVILGDDINIFSKNDQRGKELPGICEWQEMDEQQQFMLGVSYKKDPLVPRLQGVKLMGDRGDKAIHINIGEADNEEEGYFDEVTEFSRLDERARELWYGMRIGWFGSRTLIDAIRKIPAGEFHGGMIADLAEDSYDLVSWEDAISWRDQVSPDVKRKLKEIDSEGGK